MSYDKVVQDNLKQMGSTHSEWKAVAVEGMAETTANGKAVSMPVFNFPKGYTEAPSLYRNSGTDMCCELCAHPIKNAYYVQNDARRWIMLVGSECVTHFEETSGQQLAKEAVWDINRQFVRDTISLKKEIAKTYSYTRAGAYGRTAQYWRNQEARKDYERLVKITKNSQPDDSQWSHLPADSNGVITRWVGKYGVEAREIMARY